MNDQNKETKICPLLNAQPEETSPECIGPLCAWYIQNRGGGCCAIAYLANIGRGC